MLVSGDSVQLLIIIYALFAFFGAYLVICICIAYSSRQRMVDQNRDNDLLRARAFLSESFLKDNWTLLFMLCIFLFIDTIMELNNITGLFIEVSISEFVSEMTRIGIIGCALISTYRWYKLMIPVKKQI